MGEREDVGLEESERVPRWGFGTEGFYLPSGVGEWMPGLMCACEWNTLADRLSGVLGR